MSSDHFAPWSERQGESGFAWSFLGAALAQTSLPFGVVNAPGQRYHPAIIAQAAATLCEMFPERLWIALGLRRGVQRAHHRRRLAAQGRSATRGCASAWTSCARCSRARRSRTTATWSWTARGCGRGRQTPPPLLCAAVSEPTARWGGEWADGLATVNAPVEHAAAAARRVRARRAGACSRSTCRGRRPQEEARADRVRPVAHERLRPAGVLGPRHAGGVRRRGEGRATRGPARQGADLVRPRAARRVAAGARRARLRRHRAPPRRPGPRPVHRRVRRARPPAAA